MYTSHADIQIRFADIDVLGHVNNAIIQHYLDIGKTVFFEDIFSFPITFKKEAFVQGNITLDFLEPIYIQDKIAVSTEVTYIGNKSFVIAQDIYEKNSLTVKVKSKATLICFDVIEKRSMNMLPHWREQLEKAMNNTEF